MALLIQGIDKGINASLPDTLIAPEEAGRRSQNIIYERGLMKTAGGFAKVDITAGTKFGDTVLSIFGWQELDGFAHEMAITRQKLYEHDRSNSQWTDRTQSGLTMSSSIYKPISWVPVAHSSAITLNDAGGVAAYHHIIVCDGGLSNIQRWAGRYETDFADLAGGGDYHDGTTHRAYHVGTHRSRIILLSPQTFSSTTNAWTEHNQQVRWPVINKIETYTGTGSGSVTLLDTGGFNVAAAPLGGSYYIYQTMGIWDLNWVGGTTIFDPRPVIPNLGLLAPHLLIEGKNVHYLIGDDYNVYAYYGGTIKQSIGDKITGLLQEQMETSLVSRMWMSLFPDGKRLGIFVVEDGGTYITKAYVMDLRSKAWQVLDFNDIYSSASGITAVSMVGGNTYEVGDSYQEALDTLSAYEVSDAGDVTIRYGDTMRGDLTTNLVDWTAVMDGAAATNYFQMLEFSNAAGGEYFSFEANTDPTMLVGTVSGLPDDDTDASGLILRIDDGSDVVNAVHGTHYYQLTDICSVNDGAGDFTVKAFLQLRDTTSAATAFVTGFAFAETSALTVQQLDAAGDCTGTLFCPSGTTYNQVVDDVRVGDKLYLGDDSGYVYAFDDLTYNYDGNAMSARHPTHVEDWQQPDKYKRWNAISVLARERTTDNGGVRVRYRTGDFDTSGTGWSGDWTQTLTSDLVEYVFYHNISSKKIQYEFDNAEGADFEIAEVKLHDPEILSNR